MRFVMHDWPNEPAKKILKLLGDAAQPSTKLVLMDNIVPYTAPNDTDIPGVQTSPMPYPLLENLGIGNFHTIRVDLHVCCPYIPPSLAVHNSCALAFGLDDGAA